MNERVTPWKVFAESNYGFFWVSLLSSTIGSQIASVAVAWQVYEITNSPFQLGLTAIFRALPLVIFSLTGGVLTDRLDRRRLFITTQSIAMSFALLLGILTTTGWIRVWHIYAVSFLAGSINTFDRPLVTAMIPSLVRREHLSTAYAMNITLRQTAFLIGPFFGGVSLAVLGIAWSYYINALSFLIVITCIFFLRVRPTTSAPKKVSALENLREGVSFVRQNPIILSLLVMDMGVMFFGAYRGMMPVFARDLLAVGPTGLGALLGAPGIGALVGSGIIMVLGNPKRKGGMIIFVTLLFTAGIMLFALSRSFWLSLFIAFCLGIFDAVGETLRVTVVQLLTPDHLRGRVESLTQIFVFGIPHMGQAWVGAAALLLTVPGALILGGVLGAATVGLMARRIMEVNRLQV